MRAEYVLVYGTSYCIGTSSLYGMFRTSCTRCVELACNRRHVPIAVLFAFVHEIEVMESSNWITQNKNATYFCFKLKWPCKICASLSTYVCRIFSANKSVPISFNCIWMGRVYHRQIAIHLPSNWVLCAQKKNVAFFLAHSINRLLLRYTLRKILYLMTNIWLASDQNLFYLIASRKISVIAMSI